MSEDWATALVWTNSTTISPHSCLHLMLSFAFRNWFTEFFFSSANPIVHSVHDVSINIVLSLFFFTFSVLPWLDIHIRCQML